MQTTTALIECKPKWITVYAKIIAIFEKLTFSHLLYIAFIFQKLIAEVARSHFLLIAFSSLQAFLNLFVSNLSLLIQCTVRSGGYELITLRQSDMSGSTPEDHKYFTSKKVHFTDHWSLRIWHALDISIYCFLPHSSQSLLADLMVIFMSLNWTNAGETLSLPAVTRYLKIRVKMLMYLMRWMTLTDACYRRCLGLSMAARPGTPLPTRLRSLLTCCCHLHPPDETYAGMWLASACYIAIGD